MFLLGLYACSKLGPKDQGEGSMEAALHSLSQLDLGYIDLYLVHWPGTQGLQVSDQRNPGWEVNCASALHSFPAKRDLKTCFCLLLLTVPPFFFIARQQSQELGLTGGVACSGEAEGHWCVQLYACTHERTDAELQNSTCSATGMDLEVVLAQKE